MNGKPIARRPRGAPSALPTANTGRIGPPDTTRPAGRPVSFRLDRAGPFDTNPPDPAFFSAGSCAPCTGMEADMTRESGSSHVRSGRWLAASTVVWVGLCTTVPAQVPAIDAIPLPSRSPMRTPAMVPRPGRGDLDDLDGRIRQQPDQAEGYFKRGRFHTQRAMTGQHAALDAAMADFSRALERDPSHTEARYWRGYVKVWRGDRDAVLADLSRVIEQDPDHARARTLRGQILAQMRQFDLALAEFDLAWEPPGCRRVRRSYPGADAVTPPWGSTSAPSRSSVAPSRKRSSCSPGYTGSGRGHTGRPGTRIKPPPISTKPSAVGPMTPGPACSDARC